MSADSRDCSPLISIVITCFNQGRFLAEAIESALGQTYSHVDIVVVDDASVDNTGEVTAKYPVAYVRLRRRQGLSAARNVGIMHSEGEYLVFLDADDRLLPRALESGHSCFNQHPECAFVSGRYRTISVDGNPLPMAERPFVTERYYCALLYYNYVGMHGTVMYRRQSLEAVHGFDTRLKACEDYDLYLRLARQFSTRAYNQEVAEYREHETSMSHDKALMLSAMSDVLRLSRKRVRSQTEWEAYRAGARRWKTAYGSALARQIARELRRFHFGRALYGLIVLLRFCPRECPRLVYSAASKITGWLGIRPPVTRGIARSGGQISE